jgi:hypothetical protein
MVVGENDTALPPNSRGKARHGRRTWFKVALDDRRGGMIKAE